MTKFNLLDVIRDCPAELLMLLFCVNSRHSTLIPRLYCKQAKKQETKTKQTKSIQISCAFRLCLLDIELIPINPLLPHNTTGGYQVAKDYLQLIYRRDVKKIKKV